jgi:RND family efflux transporter MFP subunit
MRRSSLIAGAICSTAILAGCSRSGAAPAPLEYVAPVSLVRVVKASVAFPIRAAGTLSSEETIRLSFAVPGIIEEIAADEGQAVRSGQILARLDIRQVQAQADQARSALDKATRDCDRAEGLFGQKAVSLELLQNAHTAKDLAASAWALAEFSLEHSVIAAPSEGVVLKQLMKRGEAASGGTTVFNFASTSKGWRLRAPVTDRALVSTRRGDRATIRLSAYPGLSFPAHIAEIADTPDPATGLFELALAFDRDPGGPVTGLCLVTGLFGWAEIRSSKASDLYLLPPEAVVEASGDRGYVFVPGPDGGAVTKIPVAIARAADEGIYVASGLEGVDRVVAKGAVFLSEGSRIVVQAGDHGTYN